MTPLLEVKNLRTVFHTEQGDVTAVDGTSFSVNPGETLAIVGESGSGKSVTALSVMGLVPSPGEIVDGQIIFRGEDLAQASELELTRLRGAHMSMVFQDPMTALNPVLTVGRQLTEAMERHLGLQGRELRERAIELLRIVGISEPENRLSDYPHEFSGGMRQRLLIAIALSCQPDLVIADEPTTALDVTIQAQILELMKDLQQEFDMSIILITHDLGVVAGIADRVLVMYAGEIVEEGPAKEVFRAPKHPYTRGLLASLPRPDEREQRLQAIEGSPPDLLNVPAGCRFYPRCPYAMRVCKEQAPPQFEHQQRRSACWLHHQQAPAVDELGKLEEVS